MDRNTKHNKAMAKQKAAVDEGIAKANIERGVSVLLTGDGKGKTSSAFGMVMRALGYGQKVGVVQFIKGVQASGEENFVRDHLPGVTLHQMGTGFTWDTQDRGKRYRRGQAHLGTCPGHVGRRQLRPGGARRAHLHAGL